MGQNPSFWGLPLLRPWENCKHNKGRKTPLHRESKVVQSVLDLLVVLFSSNRESGVNPGNRFMHTFDDAKPVAEADQNSPVHTCFV